MCLNIDQCIKDNQALLDDVKLPWNQPICRNSTYHQVIMKEKHDFNAFSFKKFKNCDPENCSKPDPLQNPDKCEKYKMDHLESGCTMLNSDCDSNGKG